MKATLFDAWGHDLSPPVVFGMLRDLSKWEGSLKSDGFVDFPRQYTFSRSKRLSPVRETGEGFCDESIFVCRATGMSLAEDYTALAPSVLRTSSRSTPLGAPKYNDRNLGCGFRARFVGFRGERPLALHLTSLFLHALP